MPTAKKLPSGSWRARVYSHTDQAGKKHYRSFTADTKKEAERLASVWNVEQKTRTSITVSEAAEKYIEAKRPILSPSTIRAYKANLPNLEPIGNKKITQLKNSDVQIWISDLAKNHKPKTVKNVYGLFMAVVSMFAPEMSFKVSLPPTDPKDYHLPTDDDIDKLLDHVKGKSLWIALVLARYYGLRRSEICALDSEDLDGDILMIRKAMVQDDNKNWIIKQRPKTSASFRSLKIEEPLLSVLQGVQGNYIDCNPDALLSRFRRAIKATGIEPFNFHLLRHMFASNAALLGIPDFYTAAFGGWSRGSSALKQIYQNVRDSDSAKMMKKLNRSMTRNMTQK